MSRRPRLVTVVTALMAIFCSGVAVAQSCQNGNAKYHQKLGGIEISCSQGSCHGSDPKSNMNGISDSGQQGDGIRLAMDTVSDMSGIRDAVGLSDADIDDIALYIWYRAANQSCPAVTPANVSASSTSLAFGDVSTGTTSAAQTVTVSNTGGSASGSISYPAAPAGYAKSGTCANGALVAGASCTLTLTLSPTAAQSYNATYTIGGAVSIAISLTGNGVSVSTSPNVNASPTSLAFGTVTTGSTSPAKTINVTNNGTTPASDMSYPAAPANYTKGGSCGSATLAAGASCTITFTYSPTAVGNDNTSYTISGGGKSIGITLSGNGAGAAVAALSATPATLSFGSITIGSTSSTQTVLLRNTGGAAASGIALASTNAAEFVVSANTCGATLPAGGTCTLAVAYQPGGAGSDSATLTFSHAGGAPATVAMSGSGTQAASPNLAAAPPLAAFGNVNVGQTSAAVTFTITNSGGAAATSVALANSNGAEFVVSGNTCGATLGAGASCALSVKYRPTAAGSDSATLTFTYTGGGALAMSLTGTGVGSNPPPGTGQLSLPAGVSMPDTTLGNTSAAHVVTVSNTGSASVSVSALTSSNPAEFAVGGSTCANVAAGAACTFTITFAPAASGARSAMVTLTSTGAGGSQVIAVSGTGLTGSATPQDPNVVVAIEYYHAAFDHYFMTSITDEVTKLDNGTFVGWQRTGKQFKVYKEPASGLNAVCRFFSTAFDPKSSHFYTPDAPECTVVKANKNWMFEAEVFFTRSPAADGACAAGTNPVYRVYNDGQGAAPNHRYTTDVAVRADMLLKGWIAEGYGVGVIMCAPQ